MIRVALPRHLQTLARVGAEVEVPVSGAVTQRAVLDALESLRSCGTIRDQTTFKRRAFVRFYACEEDLARSARRPAARRRGPRRRAVRSSARSRADEHGR